MPFSNVSPNLGSTSHGTEFDPLTITAHAALKSIIEYMEFTEDSINKCIFIHPEIWATTNRICYPSIIFDLRTVSHHHLYVPLFRLLGVTVTHAYVKDS